MGAWLQQHLGLLIQFTVFITCSVVLLLLKPRDLSARLAIAALVFAGFRGQRRVAWRRVRCCPRAFVR